MALFPEVAYAEALKRARRRVVVDTETLTTARAMIDAIRAGGDECVQSYARQFGESGRVYEREALRAAWSDLPVEQKAVLDRVAERISGFALAQRQAFHDLEVERDGAFLSHRLMPVRRAGCYVPGGKYPLPSSLFMTALTARAAGVNEVVVCCPRPTPVVLAAAARAGVDAVVALGGVQAVASMAFGLAGLPATDVIVGPGNRWLSAAKQLLAGEVRMDLPAGPSELVVVLDQSTNLKLAAADLIAQAEHDPDALPVAVSVGAFDFERLRAEMQQQLNTLPTSETAVAALERGFCVTTADLEDAVVLIDALAPEHLSLQIRDSAGAAGLFSDFGAMFVGEQASEALADYGIGPNHVLPTGGAARQYGALSVLNFLRVQTTVRVERVNLTAVQDCEVLAKMEGLHGHARSLAWRLPGAIPP